MKAPAFGLLLLTEGDSITKSGVVELSGALSGERHQVPTTLRPGVDVVADVSNTDNNCSASMQVTAWEPVHPILSAGSPLEANVVTAVIDPPSRRRVNHRPRSPHRRHV